MNKYELDEDGIPLAHYFPAEVDQVPLPEHPSSWVADYYIDSPALHCNNVISAAPIDQVLAIATRVVEEMKEWQAKAKAAGHAHAFLMFDGSFFWAVYRRRATLEDIAKLKQEAREEIEYAEKALEERARALAFLAKMGDDGE